MSDTARRESYADHNEVTAEPAQISTGISPHSGRHFLGLDGLRGVAAFVVVLFHGTIALEIGYVPGAACLAVDFFFVLSGFVIAYAYDDRLNQNRMSWCQFMVARLIRLYPMLFIGTLAGGTPTIGLWLIQRHDLDIVPFLITMAGSFVLLPIGFAFGTVAYPINIVVWSLFFEFVVNAFYGSRFRTLSNRNLIMFVAVSGIAMIPVVLWGAPYSAIGFATPPAFLLGFVRVVYPFWGGVLLFRVARLRVMPGIPIGLIGFMLAFLLLIPLDNQIYNLMLGLMLFPILVAFAACAKMSDLTARVCSALGRLSYPLYLIHWPVFLVVRRLPEVMHLHVSPLVMLIGGIITAVIAAEILLLGFDEPVRRWLNRKVRRQPQQAVQC